MENTKNIKKILKSKKVIMVAAMALMVALVVGMGAMTYSRYVSSADMDTPATATVAKWGYVVNINTANMFGHTYEGGVVNNTFAGTENNEIDVQATLVGENRANVVAPGTSGYITLSINGVAEVLAELTILFDETDDATKDLVLTYKANEGDEDTLTYSPLKWTLTKVETTEGSDGEETTTTTVMDGFEDVSLDTLVAGLADWSAKYAIGDSANVVYTISWEWALDNDVDDLPEGITVNDLDTALGMISAGIDEEDIEAATGIYLIKDAEGSLATEDAEGNTLYNTTLSVKVAASVTQIQDAEPETEEP